MKCLICGSPESKVIDSRPSEDNSIIRRRRECSVCGKRFTTHETIELMPVYVIKTNGNRQQFDRDKIKRGVLFAAANRPVPLEQIDNLVSEIERQINNSLRQEVTSKEIGEMVMKGLKDIDEVTYIRFASVYRQFKDTNTFLQEMVKLMGGKSNK